MIKKLLMLSALLNVSHTAFASITHLYDYASLVDALNNGHRVQVVIHEKKCLVTEYEKKGQDTQHPNLPGDDITIGMGFNNDFFLLKQEDNAKRFFVATISNHSFFKGRDKEQLYKLVRVFDDSEVELYHSRTSEKKGFLGGTKLSCQIQTVEHPEGAVKLVDYDG